MFNPRYPRPDTAPAVLAEPTSTAPAASAEERTRIVQPAMQAPIQAPPTPAARPHVHLTPGVLITLAAGGTAAVLVIGTVLVSILLAIAITAVSVAICALVIRSLLNSNHRKDI